MASSAPAQQPAQQRNAQESLKEFETRMSKMVSRLEMTDTVFFYKRISKSMATEVVQGSIAYSLEFPHNFLTQHSQKFGKDVTLETTDSHQTWPIKITIRSFEGSKVRVYAYGLGGWKAFLMDNHIKVGDILIFKLIRWSHFEVVIGRSPIEVPSNDNNNAHQDNVPLWPKFVVTIHRPSEPEHPENHFYLEKDLSLLIPLHFWELHSHMLEGDKLQLKGPSNTIMMVKVERTYNIEVQKVCLEHSSWKAFLLANNLAIGDNLEFSLIGNSCFKVKVVEWIGNH